MSTQEDAALIELLRLLSRRSYRFVTPTPTTHARVVARKGMATNARDALGWSLPFQPDALDGDLVALLHAGGVVSEHPQGLVSRVRVASAEGGYFLHSAYPTEAADAVFFGPDSYRFARFIRAHLDVSDIVRCVDIGVGAGIGAYTLSSMTGAQIIATDINPLALRYARINFAAANKTLETVLASGLEAVTDPIDVVIANPPYIVDPSHRFYRDGGGAHGGEVSLDWADQAAALLKPGGQFLLYTGAAIVDGQDLLEPKLRHILKDFDVGYHQLDPDVFGEELERPAYRDVERIAVVGVTAVKR